MLLFIKYNYFDKGNLKEKNKMKYIYFFLYFSGPLGLTISGSEDIFEPIVVSDLCEGGLADK
jgi:hypothetical protein